MDPGILVERYLPEATIRVLAKERNVVVSRKSKPELVTDLVAAVGVDGMWELLDSEFEVGRGAVYWFSPAGLNDLTKAGIEDALEASCGFDPFDTDAAPDIGNQPAIICARWIGGTRLQVYVARSVRQSIIVRLERQILLRTNVTVAFMSIGDHLLESWGDAQASPQIAKVVSAAMGLTGFLAPAAVDSTEIRALNELLQAKLVSDRFRDDEGVYDLIELRKRPEDNSLDDVADYVERHAGKPHLKKVVEFNVPGLDKSVTMEITKQGGFRFPAYTLREAVDYVLQCVREIKGI